MTSDYYAQRAQQISDNAFAGITDSIAITLHFLFATEFGWLIFGIAGICVLLTMLDGVPNPAYRPPQPKPSPKQIAETIKTYELQLPPPHWSDKQHYATLACLFIGCASLVGSVWWFAAHQ